MFEEFIET